MKCCSLQDVGVYFCSTNIQDWQINSIVINSTNHILPLFVSRHGNQFKSVDNHLILSRNPGRLSLWLHEGPISNRCPPALSDFSNAHTCENITSLQFLKFVIQGLSLSSATRIQVRILHPYTFLMLSFLLYLPLTILCGITLERVSWDDTCSN